MLLDAAFGQRRDRVLGEGLGAAEFAARDHMQDAQGQIVLVEPPSMSMSEPWKRLPRFETMKLVR